MEHFTPSHLLSALYEAGIRRDNFFLRMFFTEVHTFAEKKVDLDMIPNKIPIAPFCMFIALAASVSAFWY